LKNDTLKQNKSTIKTGDKVMNQFLRRHWLQAALLGTAIAFVGNVQAQNYPSKPIRLVVPFTTGGVTDTSGRLIAEQLSKRLGQQVIVDNKPGASGNIGTVINPHVFPKTGFDTLKDFAPIGKIGDAVLILVAHPNFPAKTLKDTIALSKTERGGLSYGTSGTGGTPHIAGELLRQKTGANLVHVPYKGGGQALTDVLGGNIPLVYTAIAGAIPHVKAGKLLPIAVSSSKRASSLPDVATFIENGVPDFEVNSWVGLLAPAKTPRAIITRINTELNAILNDPEVKERLNGMGITASPGTSENFGAELSRDLAKFGPVVKASGIKVE